MGPVSPECKRSRPVRTVWAIIPTAPLLKDPYNLPPVQGKHGEAVQSLRPPSRSATLGSSTDLIEAPVACFDHEDTPYTVCMLLYA